MEYTKATLEQLEELEAVVPDHLALAGFAGKMEPEMILEQTIHSSLFHHRAGRPLALGSPLNPRVRGDRDNRLQMMLERGWVCVEESSPIVVDGDVCNELIFITDVGYREIVSHIAELKIRRSKRTQ